MNEIKRIYNIKTLLLFGILLLLNGIVIINGNKDTNVARIYDEMIQILDNNYADSTSCVESATKTWEQYFKDYGINSSDKSAETLSAKEARQLLITNANYIDNFKTEILKKEQTALLYAKSGTYKTNSFEYMNILKTKDDLLALTDLDVKLSNGIWLEKLYQNDYIHIYVLLICFLTVYYFFIERKNGLYYIIHASSNGRGKLFLKRCGILFIQSLLMNVIFYFEAVLLLLNIYGGKNAINVVAASDEYFLLTTGALTRIEFVGVLVLLSSIASTTLSLLLWLILSCFSNINVGIFIYGVVCGIDIVLYKFISVKSALRALRFINIYYLFFPNKSLGYYNWGYSWGITTVAVTIVAFTLLIGTLALIINVYRTINQYFNGRENVIEVLLKKIFVLFMRLIEKTPNMIKEIYKVLISQRIGMVLLVLIYIALTIQPRVGVIYDAKKSYLSGYYKTAEGLSYGSKLESIYNDYLNDYNQFVEEMDYSIENAEALIENRKDMITDIQQHVEFVKKMNEQGTKSVVLKPYEYMEAIGSKESNNQKELALLNVLAAIVIACGFISYEKKVLIHKTILAYENRRKWLVKKMITNGILVMMFACITYGIYYYKLSRVYHFEKILSPLKSLPAFSDFIINPSIIGFIIIDFLVKIIIFICIQAVVHWISIYVKYLFCFFGGMAITIPQLLYMIGFDYLDKFCIGKYIAFFPCFLDGQNAMILYCLFVIVLFIAGISSVIFILRKETMDS